MEPDYADTDALIIEKFLPNISSYGLSYRVERWDGTEAIYHGRNLMSFDEFYTNWDGKTNKPPPIPKDLGECKHKKKYINKSVHNPDFWYVVCPSCLESWDI